MKISFACTLRSGKHCWSCHLSLEDVACFVIKTIIRQKKSHPMGTVEAKFRAIPCLVAVVEGSSPSHWFVGWAAVGCICPRAIVVLPRLQLILYCLSQCSVNEAGGIPQFCSSFSMILAILVPLPFRGNFKVTLLMSVIDTVEILTGIALNLKISLGELKSLYLHLQSMSMVYLPIYFIFKKLSLTFFHLDSGHILLNVLLSISFY